MIKNDLKNKIIQKRQLEIDEDDELLLKLIDSINNKKNKVRYPK